MAVIDEMPFSIVEYTGFMEFVIGLNPYSKWFLEMDSVSKCWKICKRSLTSIGLSLTWQIVYK
jgi:hypothetical protein